MPTSLTVSTLPDLYKALAGAKGGETILLAPGDYGNMMLAAKSGFDITFPSNVTITSADPDNPASFSGLDIRGAANLTFDGVIFDYTFKPGAPVWDNAFKVSGSENITIRNSTFDGDLAQGVSTAADGFGTGIGLSVRDSRGIVLEDNEAFDFYKGIAISQTDGLVVAGNDVHSMRMDGLNFAEVTDAVIEANYIHDFRTSPTSLDHCDMIQFWTNGTDAPSSDIVIRNNRLDIGTGGATQSIFMRNDQVDRGLAGTEMFYRNVTIENNVIVNGHLHGITVGETAGLTIRGNSVLHADGGQADGADAAVEIPMINLAATSTGVVVAQNATGGLTGWTGQAGWQISGNAFVQDQNPQAPGWYGDVFVTSSLGLENGVHDFVPLPGGMIDRLGAGADLPFGSGLSPDFQVSRHETYLQAHLFDAGPGDLPAGTIYQWDFGDGTKAEGRQVAHNYADGGSYQVTLTARLPDGATLRESAKVDVQGLEVLSLGEDGRFRAHEAGQEIVLATPAGTADGLQLGATGVTASVARSHVTDILGAEDFSIALELTADRATSAGEVFRLHGSIVANVTAKGELMLQLSPTVGSMVTMTTSGARLNDLATHDIDIRMDDGQMQIWIDDKLSVARDLPGPLANSGRHDLTFGNAWGRANFNGDLSGFEIEVGETPATPDRFDFLDNQADAPAAGPVWGSMGAWGGMSLAFG